jgi:hypothetical protein
MTWTEEGKIRPRTCSRLGSHKRMIEHDALAVRIMAKRVNLCTRHPPLASMETMLKDNPASTQESFAPAPPVCREKEQEQDRDNALAVNRVSAQPPRRLRNCSEKKASTVPGWGAVLELFAIFGWHPYLARWIRDGR